MLVKWLYFMVYVLGNVGYGFIGILGYVINEVICFVFSFILFVVSND